MRSIADFYEKFPANLLIAVERFLLYRVLDTSTIVAWLFAPEQASKSLGLGFYFYNKILISRYNWREILRMVMGKVVLRVRNATIEMTFAEEELKYNQGFQVEIYIYN